MYYTEEGAKRHADYLVERMGKERALAYGKSKQFYAAQRRHFTRETYYATLVAHIEGAAE